MTGQYGDPNERGYGSGATRGVNYNQHGSTSTTKQSAGALTVGAKSRGRGRGRMVVTGFDELDNLLEEIASEDGPRSINAAMRKALREAAKTIIVPKIKELIPVDTGFLEDQITVRAIKRSRKKVGIFVGFRDPLFQGDTFYGGFLEYGWDHIKGVHVAADSFLRRALYPEANVIISYVRNYMQTWVNQINATT